MIANLQELEYCLRRWGRAFGERPEVVDDTDLDDAIDSNRRKNADSLIALAMEHGLKTKRTEAAPMHTNRSRGRLLLQGAAAGLLTNDGKATRAAPAWAVDPIRPPSGSGYSDPVAEAVERAALQLYSFDRFMGVVLRVEYCALGRFREKVERAGKCLEVNMPARVYRQNLDRAKVWLAGRLA
jgi:hypothetical protein